MTYEDLESQRVENQARLEEIENALMRKRENQSTGYIIREKMGLTNNSQPGDPIIWDGDKKEATFGSPARSKSVKAPKSGKSSSKKVKFEVSKDQTQPGNFRTGFTPKKQASPVHEPPSPRRAIYEAKFEKYLAQKEM